MISRAEGLRTPRKAMVRVDHPPLLSTIDNLLVVVYRELTWVYTRNVVKGVVALKGVGVSNYFSNYAYESCCGAVQTSDPRYHAARLSCRCVWCVLRNNGCQSPGS